MRLLAEHWEQGEELRGEVLVEMENDGDTYVEIEEPFIATLARGEFKEDVYPRPIGSDPVALAGLASSHSTSDTPATSDEAALLLATEMGDTAEVVRLHENGVNLEAKNSYKQTPLMYAAMRGNTGLAERLIELGADLEAKDNDGQTPLMLATTMGNTETAERLVELGTGSKE